MKNSIMGDLDALRSDWAAMRDEIRNGGGHHIHQEAFFTLMLDLADAYFQKLEAMTAGEED